MRRMTLGRAGALAAITAALCLAQGGVLAAEAYAQTYYLDSGSVTVTASDGKQYVTQEGVVDNEEQTSDTVIRQTDSTTATANTVAVISGSGQTAKVTLSGVNIDVSGGSWSSFGLAAFSVSGEGSATVELIGKNTVMSGYGHAGVEKGNGGNLTITAKDTGQSLTAAGAGGAGIGGGWQCSVSDMTIAGGTIDATGQPDGSWWGGAGIGGGASGSGSSITITGGKVTATGGPNASGIGGGNGGSGSDITISGGTVTATGDSSGAGIGGWGDIVTGAGGGSRITITGGEVVAAGDSGGAGIGGSYGSNGTDITITGGKVTATGGHNGAGIGGGKSEGDQSGNCTNVTITGGEVVATGGYEAAGIGGAIDYGTCENVNISGGKVTATGGDGGPGIGGMDFSLRGDPVRDPSCSGVSISGGDVTCVGGDGAAGIGGGADLWEDHYTTCGDVTVSGSARLRVRGGMGYAAGAGIGGGCWWAGSYHDGAEVAPDVCGLSTDGWIEYYAAGADMAKADPTQTVTGTGGHDWDETTYAWSEDHSSCTATHICKRNAEHKETETAAVIAKVTQEKSCTDDELTAYTATFENAAFEEQVLADVKTADATGHAPETVPAVAATCTEDGLTEGSRCSACGTVLTEQKPVPATGHDFTAEKAEPAYLKSAATCIKSAVYYRSCASCGESSKGTEDEATFENGEPDATAHQDLEHVAAKAATTKAEGNIEYWYCSECDKYFSDAAGTKEISKADTVIAKKAEPKKEDKKALPKTGDDAATQLGLLFAGGLTTLGAAFIAKRRAA